MPQLGAQPCQILVLQKPGSNDQRYEIGSAVSPEVVMNKSVVTAAISLTVLGVGSAWGATTTGRITYISSHRDRLMLNNSEMYGVEPGIDLSSIAVADRVKIRWEKGDGQNVITAIALAPLTAAAPS